MRCVSSLSKVLESSLCERPRTVHCMELAYTHLSCAQLYAMPSSESPFLVSSSGGYQCIPKETSSPKTKNINGQVLSYDWCLHRNVGFPIQLQSCSTKITQSGSIMSVGTTYSTGVYHIRSPHGTSKYFSNYKPPSCTNVEAGDAIAWMAKSYSWSNRLCFSQTPCHAATPKASRNSDGWIGKFFDCYQIGQSCLLFALFTRHMHFIYPKSLGGGDIILQAT